MCGICGLYNHKTGSPVNPALIQAMTRTMIHRGPDDDGLYINKSFGFGMRRLSIIDVEGGSQPIHNEDKTIWIVFNGEIYNFPELQKELKTKGHRFYTKSDTEVIVHAYEEWGDDCLLKLNGIFGLSLWDEKKKRLLLARDPFGVKPIYYYDDGKRLLWGSEIKAILADSTVPKIVDPQALSLFLTFRFAPSPFTLFKGIQKVRPGHKVVFENGKLSIKRYFFSKPDIDSTLTKKDCVHILREKLETAVKRQMISDVPVGLLLSGGIDSAVVLAIMSQATSLPVHTFTVGFKDGDDVNELEEARLTAKHFGSNHNEVLMDSLDYTEWLKKSIWHLEEPNGTTSALPMYFVSKLASEHVKVVLTGQGADEPFCGYHRYYGERYGSLYRNLPIALRDYAIRPVIEAFPRQERIKRAVGSLGISDTAKRFVQMYSVFDGGMQKRLWKDAESLFSENKDVADESVVNYWRKGIEHLPPLVQMSYVDARLLLPDDLLMYGDKMSMAASVEARVPFLDIEFMLFAESLPEHMRISGITRKYIHKKAIESWLPKRIIKRKKRGFETPIDRWFRAEMTGYVRRTLLEKHSACSTYFRQSAVENLLREHVSGKRDNRRQIYCLLVFELWHRIFIDGKIKEGAIGKKR